MKLAAKESKRAAWLLCVVTTLWINCQLADSIAVMSIDFGSEWLKVAIVKPGVPMEIVLNQESKRKTPTIVLLKDDERLFGDAAAATGIRFPKNAYTYLQNVIGKPFKSPQVELYRKRFPYYDLVEDVVRGTVLFQHGSETYSPEELLAMIFKNCQTFTEAYANQTIKDTVITVPAFFNQAERRAVVDAATLAGLKVLQLLNDNTAVALNYGVFRRAEFNTSAVNVMFYDVGASSAVATVVSYQLTKVKEHGIAETVPQLTIRGIGYDQFFGGLEFDLRLRDHLAKLFKEQGKAKSDVTKSPRAMAKLLKEAKRLKKVLSANVDHLSQIEGLIDDIDFKAKVTRDEFESLCSDLFERVKGPVDRALASSQMILGEINQVIVMGGGSRMPKLQEKLLEAVKKPELGKSINADEAAAMGAVYVSAFLSKAFRVKKFVIKDANLFPIQVSFERERVEEDGGSSMRRVTRTLFGHTNPFPQKKVMTFNRHKRDFFFNVDYGDVSFLPEESRTAIGALNLSRVSLSGVEQAFTKHTDTKDEAKGIKAHFRMDGGGLLHLDKVEAVFERPPEEEKPPEEKSAFEKLSSTISNLFGSSDESTTEAPTEEASTEPAEEMDSEEESETEKSDDSDANQADTKTPSDEETTDEKQEKQSKEKETASEASDSQASDEDIESESTSEEAEFPQDESDETANEQAESEETSKSEGVQDTEEEATDSDKTGDKEAEKEPVSADDNKSKPEEKLTDESPTTDKANDTESSNDTAKSTTTGNNTVNATKTDQAKKSAPKPTIVQESIEIMTVMLDLPLPTETHMSDWSKKLADLDQRDEEKKQLEQAKNNLESHIFETQDAINADAVITVTTESERDKVSQALAAASDWLYDEGDGATTKVYESKLAELKKLSKDIFYRVKEMAARPAGIALLKHTTNLSEVFLTRVRNISEDEQIYTEVEIQTLANVTRDTNKWLFEMETKQNATSPKDDPILTTTMLKEKQAKLDREIMYLISKAKWAKPLKPKASNATQSNQTTANQTVSDGFTPINATDSEAPTSDQQSEEKPMKEDGGDTQTEPTDSTDSTDSTDTEKDEETLALPGTGDGQSDTPEASEMDSNDDVTGKTDEHGEL